MASHFRFDVSRLVVWQSSHSLPLDASLNLAWHGLNTHTHTHTLDFPPCAAKFSLTPLGQKRRKIERGRVCQKLCIANFSAYIFHKTDACFSCLLAYFVLGFSIFRFFFSPQPIPLPEKKKKKPPAGGHILLENLLPSSSTDFKCFNRNLSNWKRPSRAEKFLDSKLGHGKRLICQPFA